MICQYHMIEIKISYKYMFKILVTITIEKVKIIHRSDYKSKIS